MLSTPLRGGNKTPRRSGLDTDRRAIVHVERLCHHCGRDIGRVEGVGRRDACLQCGWDLHCCLNCTFHDRAYNNECREPQAERQVDKEAGNFCEYFSFRAAAAPKPGATKDDARRQLDSLFSKKK